MVKMVVTPRGIVYPWGFPEVATQLLRMVREGEAVSQGAAKDRGRHDSMGASGPTTSGPFNNFFSGPSPLVLGTQSKSFIKGQSPRPTSLFPFSSFLLF